MSLRFLLASLSLLLAFEQPPAVTGVHVNGQLVTATGSCTPNVASLTFATVQAAFNAATTSGVTVCLPAGTAHWSTAEMVWNAPANATLMGQGSLSTVGGGDATVIIDDLADGNDALLAIYAGGNNLRVAGITVQGGTGITKNHGFIKLSSSAAAIRTGVRVDHVHINSGTGSSTSDSMKIYGVYGVLDHSILDRNVFFWLPDTSGQGHLTWSQPSNFGSGDFFFIEDDQWSATFGMDDCSHGGRFVIRHNNPATDVQTHPTGSGNGRGCRAFEVYANAFNNTGSPFNAMYMSSGTALFWGNTIGSNYSNRITMHASRREGQSAGGTYNQTATPAGFGYCGTSFNGTGSAWDENTSTTTGYRCMDNPGQGQGDLLTGDFPTMLNNRTGTIAWPQQLTEPVYEWGNTYTGSAYTFAVAAEAQVLNANAEYYTFTSSFTGASGTGQGLMSAIPATCTAGVVYFATDAAALYKCTATNTWRWTYSPYTYPHPLIGALPRNNDASYFPLVENPISEGSVWTGGQSAGSNLWGDVRTTANLAFGVSEPTQFGDPTAILKGTWGATQAANGLVRIVTQPTTCCHEIELRLRTTINSVAHTITGYEFYCSAASGGGGNSYCHIASWGGPNGAYVNMEGSAPSLFLVNGDTMTATVTGTTSTTLTLYINGVQKIQVVDTGAFTFSDGHQYGPWTTGAPGIGFYNNQDSNWNFFGFSKFSAVSQ